MYMYMYVYMYIYILSASWKLPGRFFMVSVVDITQRFRTVSVVGFLWFPSSQETFFYGFRRWFFNGFRRGKKRFLMVSVAERFLMVSTFFNGFRR